MLLVDDDDNYWELVKIALARGGFATAPSIERVADGTEALAYLRARRELPQLVLLDQRMPRMDGTEVLAEMRSDERLRGVPVCFMSTSDERDVVEAAYRGGASFFIAKPLDFSDLVEKLRRIVEFWNGVAELPYN